VESKKQNSSDLNMTESTTGSTYSSSSNSSRVSRNPKLDQILMKNAMNQLKGGATIKVSDNDSIKLEHISIGTKSKKSKSSNELIKKKQSPMTITTKAKKK
jgi:hypothetical protein